MGDICVHFRVLFIRQDIDESDEFFLLKKYIGNSQHTYLLQLVLQQANFCLRAEGQTRIAKLSETKE